MRNKKEINAKYNNIPIKLTATYYGQSSSINVISLESYNSILEMNYSNYLNSNNKFSYDNEEAKIGIINHIIHDSINSGNSELIFANFYSNEIKDNNEINNIKYGIFLTTDGIYKGYTKFEKGNYDKTKLFKKISYNEALNLIKESTSNFISNIDIEHQEEMKSFINNYIESEMQNLQNCISENIDILKTYVKYANKKIQEEEFKINNQKILCKKLDELI